MLKFLGRRKRMRCNTQLIFLLAIVLTGFAPSPAVFAETASLERLKEIAERGVHVMPFDLNQTQHIFSKTETGGIQQVVVIKPDNTRQIELIRQHLFKISQAFSRGDFSNSAKIHGQDMPGLAELRKAEPGQLHIEYKTINHGAEIIYSAEQPGLINAVHRWFDAQLSDHGSDAISGHGAMHEGHKMHHMHDIKNKPQ